jgi:hypothetical protein
MTGPIPLHQTAAVVFSIGGLAERGALSRGGLSGAPATVGCEVWR